MRHAAGVQETAARLKDGVNRLGHHSKVKMGSQGSKEIKIINSGFSLQTVGHDLLGAKISTWLTAKKPKHKSNTVTNSVKTLKMVYTYTHTKKKKKALRKCFEALM